MIPLWMIEEHTESFIVRDANRQALGFSPPSRRGPHCDPDGTPRRRACRCSLSLMLLLRPVAAQR